MKVTLRPVKLNESSYDVRLLHQTLKALGWQVTAKEAAAGKAGKDTLEKVRKLQAQLNVPVDKSMLVDRTTINAIKEALANRGLAAASRSFTVEGKVRLRNGGVKSRQQLLAFDLDLRGAAIYRSVKNLVDVQKNGGFEYLGKAESDAEGAYSITFYDWQYQQAERGKADVVVFAVVEEEIVGRSRMVHAEDYSDKGLVSDLDVFIAREDQRTEYELLMETLNPFLAESQTTFGEIAASSDQLTFTAGELDLSLAHLKIAASAELLVRDEQRQLSHELLYGIGRQKIELSWPSLYKKRDEELRRAIAQSVEERIIRGFTNEEIVLFLRTVHELSGKALLDNSQGQNGNGLDRMLSNALPEEQQRLSFVGALRSFTGSDFREFWSAHLPSQPEFKSQPHLLSALLLTQQLTLLTGNHQALVRELQVSRGITSAPQLLALEKDQWLEMIEKTGTPPTIEGKSEEEKATRYAQFMESLLNAAFPTQRIARMVEEKSLTFQNDEVAHGIGAFLSQQKEFDISRSRLHDFDQQIKDAAGDQAAEVKSELMKIQRVFQVSPNPEVMSELLKNNLHSAYTIANIPQKSFIKTYAESLGGESVAFAIYQRASHISARTELAAVHMTEYMQDTVPQYAMGNVENTEAIESIKKNVPNYAELFGSPDMCECAHCNSVYSAAAYFVDLLRFLWRGEPNGEGKTPLDKLSERRPDLVYLPLTCENTNTIIPYIDLVNEVMEYYTAHGSLTNFKGYDTGETTDAELRANPQNFDLEAYRNLKNAKYPFTLPYHQPLDVIRTYSRRLKVSRYEAMKAMNPQPNSTTSHAIEAEALDLSEEEYKILTGKAFDGTADSTPLHQYFGYSTANDLEQMSAAREFLSRSGVVYTELVELVKTLFINPFQGTLDFLQKFFIHASISANAIYTKLKQIKAGTLNPASDPDIVAALAAYNQENGTSISSAGFAQWVTAYLAQFQKVITLYEPHSRCALDTTSLRTMESIYESLSTSGLTVNDWSKTHRFIRLWRKLGWTIHETDLMLAALGETDITPSTIGKLEYVLSLQDTMKLPLNQLATLWGNIDTYGERSLYKKLFLNKAVQQIDQAFESDAWGNYLQSNTETLDKHQSAILAAFRITEESLSAILEVAQVIDGGNARPLALNTDILNLPNLSVIYRFVILAKGLKMPVTELCKLVRLFGAAPFSAWDIQQQKFLNISPDVTYDFYRLAAATKETGFKASALEYILQGTLPVDSKAGLDKENILRTARDIRSAFTAIEQDHPATPSSPLTSAILTAELSLTFKPEIVSSFIEIVEGTASFEAITDANLAVTIPDNLAERFSYIKGSGRLTSKGVMSSDEQTALKTLPNANANFGVAVDALYTAPENFISVNFDGVFNDLAETNRKLLDHPKQTPAATLDEKLAYIYESFVPALKSKLRHSALTRYIAALIGISEEATALLIAADMESLITSLSTEGYSANYFSDATWTTSVLRRTEETINFSWGAGSPDPLVPVDNFSARWETYITAPASGEYTLVVETEGADETFNLYLDEARILRKQSSDSSTTWEVLVNLNASKMYRLTLEYTEATQKAGIRLSWKTATTALEIIPASSAYPADILDDFLTLAILFHRASKFILGFKLSETEINHLITFKVDFGNINFKALDAGDWNRLYAYTTLRNGVPQAQALLTDLFALAEKANPAPTVADLRTKLYQATAWDEASLKFLVDTYFALTVADFKNEIALNRLYEVMKAVSRSALSAETIALWGAVETNFDKLHATAQKLKNAVKAKYEEAEWLELAGGLSDQIRGNQKNALIGYLLTRPDIQAWGAEDADGLFEYFLIDVQMGACMDTSRIVQANASVQMFVNRCLLNLESDIAGTTEKGVSPGAIDKDRWEWMKNYRVWEANRKVFLYPENWLEPEWRNDRSQFFKELESYLVQNDITDSSVEQAFRNYLRSLNDVAHLEVCGLHRENYDDGSLKYLHVFARTHNAPYKFFYRRWNQYRKWSAWESVALDIRCVEDGAYSGVHLIPVVWKKRLFLFFPEFKEAHRGPSKGNRSMSQVANDQISTLESKQYWEVRLAWSEYVDGKWSPKQVSKEFSEEWPDNSFKTLSDLIITASIDTTTQELTILISDAEWNIHRGEFVLSDIQSSIQANHWGNAGMTLPRASVYRYGFSTRVTYGTLELLDDIYLQESTTHKLLPVDTFKGLDITLDNPFFFSDDYRTYFVRPVPITIIEHFQTPQDFTPVVPVDTSGFYIPVDVPHVGPDDYIPVDLLDPQIAIGHASYFVTIPGDSRPAIVSLTGNGSVLGGKIANVGAHSLRAGAGVARNGMLTKSGATSGKLMGDTATEAMMSGTAYIGSAFVEYAPGITTMIATGDYIRQDTGLEFHTFYHPFSSRYVTNLNQGDLPGLMKSDTTIPSDSGATFETVYDPNFMHGFVQKPSDFASRTYYKENVCFDVYGANSIYNWELFFHAPLYIATRLSKNGKFEEAMKWFHYIFDPTTDEMPAAGETEVSRYWKVLPFKTAPAENLEDWFKSLSPNTDPNTENAIIGEWRDHPFDPHLVASNRPLAYMKHVVIKYVENLIAWGDSLFRQDTMESVNEALQIYVIANHVLGSRPELVPKRGEIRAETYDSLRNKWDDFSNALVELENIFPYSSEASVSGASPGPSLLGLGPSLYFCIPANDKLMEVWDTVADRLFKIRHCQNIEGVERKLALFAPPIDPAALIQATSQGLSLGSILADLSSPPPIYRFSYLIQKASEFCSEVKALGAALLATLEKKDGEELSRLRASHETQMLEMMTAIKERQVLDAGAKKEGLEKSRETASFRLQHYVELLGHDSLTVPAPPTISATLSADSQLPADTTIATVATDIDDSLTDSGERGVKLIPKEKEQLEKANTAKWLTLASGTGEALAGIFHLFPQLDAEGTPFGVGAGAWWGGQNLGAGTSAVAKVLSVAASHLSQEATQAATMAGHIRREQDWTLQANLAAKEIIQLDKQITSADIQIQVAEKELEHHRQQIENSKQIELFLKDKFTNQELYQWSKEQLFAVYKQSYNLAYDMAKKAEKAYKYEVGTETASFIQYGYWDNSKQGLVSGEKLQLALRQLEKSYLEENRRELELSKSISLAMLNPLALIELKETGKCQVSLPEEIFDLDYQGHYFRRIKAVGLSIPSVVGPYTVVNCSLRLLSNSIRVNTTMNSAGNYEHENDEGMWIDDDRFLTNNVPTTAIATSTAQDDTGLFEFNFRDERYLPFERAGVISSWSLELTTDKDLRQFDYSTIADVILHLRFTARENGGLFKDNAVTYIKNFIKNIDDLSDQPLTRMFRMKHEFPTEWHKFLHPSTTGGDQILSFTLEKERFPFFAQRRNIIVMQLDVFAKCAHAGDYHLLLSYTDSVGNTVDSTQITMPQSNRYGGMNKATLPDALHPEVDLEELDVKGSMSLKLKESTALNYKSLLTKPSDEVEDLFLVVHYKLG